MTRIIAGQFAGRRLTVPAAGARPTTDRVREALFSALQHRLGDWSGCRVLDLFAGSGGLGLEALSRGAAWATFVERDRAVLAVLRANIAALDAADRATVVAADALRWLPAPGGPGYDLLLADPPYQVPAGSVAGALGRLEAAGALSTDCLVVVERPSRDSVPPWPSHWAAQDRRRYGETALWFGGTRHDGEDT